MIGVDGSAASQLAHCAACPSWRELRGERAAALTAAADHALRVHDDKATAAQLRELATRAAKRAMPKMSEVTGMVIP